MKRRAFLSRAAGAFGLASFAGGNLLLSAQSEEQELTADAVIIGAGTGGCAAALALARNGYRVILTEETDWIGGQLTQQMVPPDEHPWIEHFGATQAYHEYRNRVRDYYRQNYELTWEARQNPYLNPGGCTVSAICHEPRVGVAVLESMFAPYISRGLVRILLRHKAISASGSGNVVTSIRVRDLESGRERELIGRYFLDATELGDLLPITKTEYVTGSESQKQTGELHAGGEARPGNMQSICWTFVMDYAAGENHVIDRPSEYPFWRDYVPDLQPGWGGKLLSWSAPIPATLQLIERQFDPRSGAKEGDRSLWTFRRMVDAKNFRAGAYNADVSLVNWPQIDYWLGNIVEVDEHEAQNNLERCRQLSLSMFYWMQTDAPRPDGGVGWPGLRLRPDIAGTFDGLAKYPYIRESRRIKAEFTVCEQHVGTEQRIKETGRPKGEVTAEHFPDSVGIGSYRIDLHPSTGRNNYIDVSSLPFEIPLGSLLPQTKENLLPACKNLGVTHITNGCYRLHPVEWNIGESAGMLAAFSMLKKEKPRGIRNRPELLADFQRTIQQQGIEIRWPTPAQTPR